MRAFGSGLMGKSWFAAAGFFLLLFTASLAVPTDRAAAQEAVKPSLRIIAPLDMAWVTVDRIHVSGAIEGIEAKSVAVKGVEVVSKGGVFLKGAVLVPWSS
jgi:hypothetical protein